MIYKFTACRVSGDGNAVFPDEIIIDEEEEVLDYRKPRVIGCKESRVRFGTIGSVSVNKGLIFADICIETKGGREIVARGFSRSDADEISRLVRQDNTIMRSRERSNFSKSADNMHNLDILIVLFL